MFKKNALERWTVGFDTSRGVVVEKLKIQNGFQFSKKPHPESPLDCRRGDRFAGGQQDARRKNLLDGSLESFKRSETYQSKVPKSNLGG
jgi:hypothetical protein